LVDADGRPTIDVVLPGYSLDTNAGVAAFCMVTLVEGLDDRGQRRRILVDPAHVGRRTFLWAALARRGLGPDAIDAVLLSHAHWDHIQNIDVFDHAPVLMHPDERAYSRAPHANDWATPAWTGAMLERQRIVDVGGGEQLLRGVRVVDMPGHSPGSIGLAVENEAGLSVITGDALHTARAAVTRENPLVFWDRDQANDSIRRVVEMADRIYPGHDRVFSITSDNQIEYLEPFQLTVSNVAPKLSDLDFDPSTPEPWTMPGIAEQAAARESFRKAAEARRIQGGTDAHHWQSHR
jgi:N-acyl homoserine lactone hydrolase